MPLPEALLNKKGATPRPPVFKTEKEFLRWQLDDIQRQVFIKSEPIVKRLSEIVVYKPYPSIMSPIGVRVDE